MGGAGGAMGIAANGGGALATTGGSGGAGGAAATSFINVAPSGIADAGTVAACVARGWNAEGVCALSAAISP